jgi:hypothetical protein
MLAERLQLETALERPIPVSRLLNDCPAREMRLGYMRALCAALSSRMSHGISGHDDHDRSIYSGPEHRACAVGQSGSRVL